MSEEIKEILDNFEKYEARYRLRNETQFIITHREIQILLDYITNLQKENKKLKELCDKYEEEHKTTFEEWKKDIKANKKAIEYINSTGYGTNFSMSAEEVDKVLNILQGVDKE